MATVFRDHTIARLYPCRVLRRNRIQRDPVNSCFTPRLFPFILCPANALTQSLEDARMKLDGQWELLPTTSFRGNYYSDEKWLTVDVPGHWQQHAELAACTGKVVYRKRFNFKKV